MLHFALKVLGFNTKWDTGENIEVTNFCNGLTFYPTPMVSVWSGGGKKFALAVSQKL